MNKLAASLILGGGIILSALALAAGRYEWQHNRSEGTHKAPLGVEIREAAEEEPPASAGAYSRTRILSRLQGEIVLESAGGVPSPIEVIVTIQGPKSIANGPMLPQIVNLSVSNRFVVEDLEAGRYQIQAQGGGWASKSIVVDVLTATPLASAKIALQPARWVVGNVQDAAGSPLRDAAVSLAVAEIGKQLKEYDRSTSDELGRFQLLMPVTEIEAAEVLVRSLDAGWRLIQVDPRACAGVSIQLLSSDTVEGEVQTADGQPVASAQIDARIDARHVAAWHQPDELDRRVATSGEQGRFQLSGLRMCDLRMQVSSAGYTSAQRTVRVPSSEPIRFELAPTRTIRGITVDAATGEPAGKVTIEAGALSRVGSKIVVESDSRGQFELSGMQSDLCTLQTSAFGYATARVEINASLTDSVVIKLERPGIVSGSLRRSDSLRLHAELLRSDGLRFRAEVQGGEPFQIEAITPGDYRATLRIHGAPVWSMSGIRVSAGTTTDLGEIVIPTGGRLKGSAILEEDGRSVGGDCSLISDHEVIEGSSERVVARCGFDGARGFDLAHIPPGRYRVLVVPTSGAPVWSDEIVVSEDEVVDIGPLLVESGGTVEARVVSAEHRPLAGVALTLKSSAGLRGGVTASDGRVRFCGVPKGSAVVLTEVGQSGSSYVSKSVDVVAGVTRHVELVAAQVNRAPWRGRLLGIDQPGGLNVLAWGSSGEWRSEVSAVDAQGIFELSPASFEDAVLEIHGLDPTRAPAFIPLRFEPSKSIVDVRCPRGGLRGDVDASVANHEIQIEAVSFEVVAPGLERIASRFRKTKADSEGRFYVPYIPNGRYRVHAASSARAARSPRLRSAEVEVRNESIVIVRIPS